jgi:hypothetical protein
MDGNGANSEMLFLSAREDLAEQGLSMEDGLVASLSSGRFALPIHNHSLTPLNLPADQILGNLVEDVTIVEPIADTDMPRQKEEIATHIKAISLGLDSERSEEIHKVLAFEELDLAADKKAQLSELITAYEDVFALHQSELGQTNVVEHVINTGDSPPLRQPARCIPFALRAKVEEMVEEMREQGVVQPSTSPWASPIVLVAKKDGTTRFCVDHRRLNAVTKKDLHPLPRIDDTLDSLAQQKYFTTLDLASGYWQVGMEHPSQEKTAFITHSGLYEFRVMPFGLCNAPATFQRLMEVVSMDWYGIAA